VSGGSETQRLRRRYEPRTCRLLCDSDAKLVATILLGNVIVFGAGALDFPN